jgi:YD repeat-containing protein
MYDTDGCQAGMDGVMTRVEQFWGSCSPAQSIVRDCAPFVIPNNFSCGPVSGGGGWHPNLEPVNTVSGAGCRETSVALLCPDNSLARTDDPALGPYCARAGFDPHKNMGDCPTCKVGNPINPGSGNKFQRETDYVGTGLFPLRFERFFNSDKSGNAAIADRSGLTLFWSHSYYRRLTFGGPVGGSTVLVSAERPDGRIFPFMLSGTAFIGDSDVNQHLEQTAAGWRLTNEADEIELYDAQGKLLSITNRIGLSQTLAYFADGKLMSVADPFGRQLVFGYDSKGRMAAMTDPAGGQYSFGYSPFGIFGIAPNLIHVTYPDLTGRTYLYENAPNQGNVLTGIVDENNARFATFGYAGAATSTEHAGGAGRVSVAYFGPTVRNVTTSVTATLTATRTYFYQLVLGVNRLSSISGDPCPSCGPASQSYDANGNVASTTDWNGNRTNYTYDLARNLETSRTEGLTSGGAPTPQTRTITTEWHPTLRLAKRVAEPLRITTSLYNGDAGASCGFAADGITLVPGALCSKSIQATTDTNGAAGLGATASGAARTWTYTYNENGQVLTMDGPRTDVADTTTYTYYADNDLDLGKRGNVATVTNAAGHTTSITAYNAHAQPLTIVDSNGLTTTLTYDPRLRLTSRTVGGENTTYTYDNAGQLTKVTLPDGSFLSYSYDAAHRLIGMEDNLGNRIVYTLDLAGNRTNEAVRDPGNALAQTRSRVYSNINRLFQEIGALGQATEYAYDNQGNVTSVKDPLNHITANQYDPLNRLKQVIDPATGVIQYAYNGLDALAQVTDPRNLATGYTVDGLGNLSQQASPDTGTTTNTYDVAGNLLTQTDAKSQTTTYTYDALNRVTLITFHDGSKQTYAYDQGAFGLGRLSSITETNPASQVTSVIAYAYELHGRVASETRTIGSTSFITAYQYDASGRLSGLIYPSGRTVTYGFDALGRVSQVSTTKGTQTLIAVQSVAYHPFGAVKGFTFGNGQPYTRNYDDDGRVSSYTLGASQFAIAYDAASRIEIINDVGNPANSNTYEYDSVDRLTRATLPSTSFIYGYDAVGNRVLKKVGLAEELYTYGTPSNPSNRLSTLTPTSGPTRTFGFDANGSTVDDGLNSYVYDTRGRMKQATSVVGTIDYQVNALGQRVRKTNSSTDTVFHYDTRGKLIAESDPGGGTYKRELIYLGDMPVMVFQ